MIEALSRGASFGVALERQPKVAQHLKAQLNHLDLASVARVWVGDACKFLRSPAKPPLAGPFGLVFLDPPYATPDPRTAAFDDRLTGEVLASLVAGNWLDNDAVIVREYACFRGRAPELQRPPGLDLVRTRSYGQTQIDVLTVVG